LVEERLKELKETCLKNQEAFADLSKELEQIMSMDSSNFDELNEMWKSMKRLK
jgi:hypothetical protein